MKHLLSGAIGAMIMALVMWLWWPGAECSEERDTITALSERNDKAQWEAKLVQHRLAKAQRELGEQLAEKVGKIDDVMPVKVQAVSKVDEEVSSITARAKSLAPVEAAVKQQATDNHEFIPAAFRSYWGKRLAEGFLMRGK